jgi:hypothetical protein
VGYVPALLPKKLLAVAPAASVATAQAVNLMVCFVDWGASKGESRSNQVVGVGVMEVEWPEL